MEVPTNALSIERLPNEMLSLIFDHLDFHSMLNSCLVCYRWFALANEHRRINRKMRLRIDKDYVTDIEEAPTFVRNYLRVHLKSIQFTRWPEFADNFPGVEELKFSRCEFGSWCYFVQIMRACSHVTTLDLFDTVILEDHDADRDMSSPGFQIRSGCLTFFDYHALKMLNIFEAIGLAFGTVRLKLMGTSGFEDLQNLFDCIKKSYGDRLTEFTFLHNMSPEGNHRLFEYLAAMKRLRLQAFTVDEVPRHSGDTEWFTTFLQQQRGLQKFELAKSVTAGQFESLSTHLSGLTELRLAVRLESAFGYITQNLGGFKRLKVLALTIEKFQDEHELVLDFLNDLDDLEQFSLEAWRLNTSEFNVNLPNRMRKMDKMLRFSVKTLPEFWFYQLQMDDEFVQALIGNMPHLVELQLYKISGLTPAGLIGGANNLQQLSGLRALALDTAVITEKVFLTFRFPHLEDLVLRGKNKTLEITDVGLEQLARESPDLKMIKTGRAIIYKRNKATNQFEFCHIPIN